MIYKTLPLNWPIQSAQGAQINEVSINFITMLQHRKLVADNQKNEETEEALIRAIVQESISISHAETKHLSRPDFNSVRNEVVNLNGRSSLHIFEKRFSEEAKKLSKELKELVKSKADEDTIAKLQKKIDECKLDYDNPELLVPITGDDGNEISSYRILPPTVDTTDMMEEYQDLYDKTIFVSMKCTGLSQEELESLSVPDWNLMQERLSDFLTESADYFRQETSKL